MKKVLKAKWLKALRSGKYEQGQGCMRSKLNGETDAISNSYAVDGKYFCCLGVLCDVMGTEWDNWGPTIKDKRISSPNMLYRPFCEQIGLDYDFMCDLTTLNDGGKTFVQIADVIEEKA